MHYLMSELECGNFQPLADAMTDDFVWTVRGRTPWSRAYVGKSVVFQELLQPLQRLLDGPFRMIVERLTAEGDIVVVQGKGNNVLRDGQRYDNTYCLVCRLRQGRLSEITEYMDTDLVMRAFGPPGVRVLRP